MQDDALPVGFRFYPTEEELVCYYLRRRYAEQHFPNVVGDLDIYEHEPWELHSKSPLKPRKNPETGKVAKEADFFFFTVSSNKYGNGPRKKRATYQGYWKATGRDREVTMEEANSTLKKKIGMKKTLVFYKGRAPHGGRTDWILNEYRLDPGPDGNKEYVINRVFNKRGDPKSQGLASDPLQADEEEAPEEADTDSPNDSGHGTSIPPRSSVGTPGQSVGHQSGDGDARASPEPVQWMGRAEDAVATRFCDGVGQEGGEQLECMYDPGMGATVGMQGGWEMNDKGEDFLEWQMPEDLKMEDAQMDWNDLGLPHQSPSPLTTPSKTDGSLMGLADDFDTWYEARNQESDTTLLWEHTDGFPGPNTPGGGDLSWNDCLMFLDQNPSLPTAEQYGNTHLAMAQATNPPYNHTSRIDPIAPQGCDSSTTTLSPSRIQIRARPVGWGAGPLMGSGGVARRVRMAVRPGLVQKQMSEGDINSRPGAGKGEVEETEASTDMVPFLSAERGKEGDMPRQGGVVPRAADRMLLLQAVQQRLRTANGPTKDKVFEKRDTSDASAGSAAEDYCKGRVGEREGVSETESRLMKGLEEDSRFRRFQSAPAGLGGGCELGRPGVEESGVEERVRNGGGSGMRGSQNLGRGKSERACQEGQFLGGNRSSRFRLVWWFFAAVAMTVGEVGRWVLWLSGFHSEKNGQVGS